MAPSRFSLSASRSTDPTEPFNPPFSLVRTTTTPPTDPVDPRPRVCLLFSPSPPPTRTHHRCVGTYIDKKCPFTGNVSIRGRILTGVVRSTKMNRTLIMRMDYLHYIKKYQRCDPVSYTLYPIPYTLYPISYTLNLIP